MSKEAEISRREFLKATTKTGVGLAAIGGIGLAPVPEQADGNPTPSQASNESARKPKGAWPQEYSVHQDEAAGHLTLSTPYYSVLHDLKQGGAIARINYTHGQASNLLVQPMGASIKLAAEKASRTLPGERQFHRPEVFSDLHDSSPSVSVAKSGKWQILNIEAVLRTPSGRDIGVRTKTTYVYRWGYIKIHKEFIFLERAVPTAQITVLSAMFHPSLTHYGHRANVFENSTVGPFGIEKVRWGKIRPGRYFDTSFETRYVPRYVVLANPGIEGIEWFVSDNLSQWDYQMTDQPGTGNATIIPSTKPLGIAVSIRPLSLPSSPNLARGGFVSLKGRYSFDYYLAMPILEGHAHQRWLERSYGPNRGQWVSDNEIRRNAEDGVVTMTLHNDGDSNGDGLYWRDGTYPPYPPAQMKKMEHVIETCHKYGIKTMPYFSNHELNQSTKAFKEQGEEWGRKSDDQGNLRPNRTYGAHMCLKSGWLRYFKSYVDTVLKHHPFDGIYYDWNMALYCNNPLHVGKASNGVSGAKGLATYAFSPTGHWDIDEFLELMEWTRERVGPDGLVTIHNTMTPMFASENFADFVVGMEWGYGKLLDGMPKPDQLPLEWNFAGARSRADIEYGTIEKDAPPRVRRLFDLTALMTGTAPWPAGAEAAKLFKTLKPLGSLDLYQFEDWRNRAIRLSGSNYLSAVYSRAGEAYVLLANLRPEAREPVCKIDPLAIKNPLASVRSAFLVDRNKMTAVRAQKLTSTGEKIPLPPEGVRLLHLKA
ncbi:MAG TPA: DUF6259 domain-containing protein [Terriglobia bacterium]|nr:DUF6259 domain-containing protein [Terriglobia bacterium]